MNKKSLATALLLAGTVFAASATPVPAGNNTSIGDVNYLTDFLPNGDGTVSFGANQTFTDTYDFTLLAANGISASAQVLFNSGNYAFSGAKGELQLYEGTFAAGHSLSSYTLLDQTSFGTNPTALTTNLVAGNYFFAVEGTTSGKKGGSYSLEVTAVPEPANAALLVAGLCLVGTLAKRRKAK